MYAPSVEEHSEPSNKQSFATIGADRRTSMNDQKNKSDLRKIFGLHQHQWITRFRGLVTRGVECRVCGKAKLLEEVNDGSEPVGWS